MRSWLYDKASRVIYACEMTDTSAHWLAAWLNTAIWIAAKFVEWLVR